MKSKLWIPVLLIVLLSTGSLMALGVKLTFDERRVLRGQYQELYSQHLQTLRSGMKQFVAKTEAELTDTLTRARFDCASLKLTGGLISACLPLRADGTLLPPPAISEPAMQDFYKRLRNAFPGSAPLVTKQPSVRSTTLSWLTYFWSDGARLVLVAHADERSICVELNKSLVTAEIIGVLPFTDARVRSQRSARGALLDEKGRELYVWGNPLLRGPFEPFVAGQLSEPLQMYQVQYAVPRGTWEQTLLTPALFTIVPSVLIVVVTLAIVTAFFFRAHDREVHDAAARVNFVNQVSHELKTPLTNIRMYAELLQRKFDEDDSDAQNHLGIIVSESHRLSRLISTILSFSLREKKGLELHPRSVRIGETVEQVLRQFAPSLAELGIAPSLQIGDDPFVAADVDAVNQILSNLIANVEKYAKGGAYLGVAAMHSGEQTSIEVEDRGPGLSDDALEKIFEPFFRTSNALTDGISGTGIGLTIARELARLHGGEIKAVRNLAGGLKFVVTLHTPRTVFAPQFREVA